MNIEDRIKAISSLGSRMRAVIYTKEDSYTAICNKAFQKNPWFTRHNIDRAMYAWSGLLTDENLKLWLSNYELLPEAKSKRVGVINAGNIPLVGLHDLISVIICGHAYFGKNASDDDLLLPYIASLLTDAEPRLKPYITFTGRLTEFDAVIATGSNNSARYFESYFGSYPHVIRKNRNAVAALSGDESPAELEGLGHDIFDYFGLGCRNVSKIYIPENYELRIFFEAMYPFGEVMQHNKYMNNFDYNNAMLLMKQIPFLQNNFLIVREDAAIASPIAVIHYEKYQDDESLASQLDSAEQQIQCLVTVKNLNLKSGLKNRIVQPGQAQSPALNDYADGVDTIRFLSAL